MKKEELDRLRAKYFEGQTSLEQERELKEQSEDAFFSSLRGGEERMDLDFEDFLALAEPVKQKSKVVPIRKRVAAFTAVAAAAILIGIYFVKPNQIKENVSSSVVSAPLGQNKNQEKAAHPEPLKQVIASVTPESVKVNQRRTRATVHPKKVMPETRIEQTGTGEQQELYVEINGVRIYDQQRALEVTQEALHLTVSNLKKGAKGIEHVKHLSIEI